MRYYLFIALFFPLLIIGQEAKIHKKGIDHTTYVPKGLEVGVKAPLIESTAISGKSINSKKILQEQEIVVIFYRGEWCPVCNRYLSNLSDSLEFISNKGAMVLVVGPENIENTEKTKEKTEAKFILLSDTTMQIQKDFDVLFNVTKAYQRRIKTFLFTDIAKNNNQEEAKLPVPATFIISKDGMIKWRHFDYDYSKRASVKSIIDQLN